MSFLEDELHPIQHEPHSLDKVSPPKILVLHGPNLNLLGTREADLYGQTTLQEIHQTLQAQAEAHGFFIETFQSNSEGALIDQIHRAVSEKFSGILINPAAYTHTSIALRDAIASINLPTVEVHLTNLHRREEFRQISFLSAVCIGVVMGFGADSYSVGLTALLHYLKRKRM